MRLSPPTRRTLRTLLPVLLTVVSVVILVIGLAPYRDGLGDALDRASFGSFLALTVLAFVSLELRTEVWRLCLAAAGPRPARDDLRVASAATYLVSLVNHYLAPGAKMWVLRRLAGTESARVIQMVTVEVAATVIEVATVGVLLVFATVRLDLPWWVPALVFASVVVALVVARQWLLRAPEHPIANGLTVLTRGHLLGRVAALLLVVFAMQIGRTWLSLDAVGLQIDIGEATLVFVVSGVLGALPTGIAAAPTAANLLVLSSGSTGAAAGSGILLTGTLVVATLAYVAVTGALRVAARRHAPPA